MHLGSLRTSKWRYVFAVSSVFLVTTILVLLPPQIVRVNLVLLYVLVIAAIALLTGRRASVIASIVAFLTYNFFFVPPFYTLAVAREADLTELVILLAVALLVATLVAQIRLQAERAARRAERMTALYKLSQEISATLSIDDILPRIARLALQLSGAEQAMISLYGTDERAAYQTSVGKPTVGATLAAPLTAGTTQLGELRLWFVGNVPQPQDEQVLLLATLANQAALAVERTHLADAALDAGVLRESERLKSALLSSVSHDLRTPLAVIKASASNLLDTSVQWEPATARGFLETIVSESDRLNRLVRNLLEMSRLEAGSLSQSREPVSLTDLTNAAIARLRPLLNTHPLHVGLDADLPDILADPVQIELVLTNLLENAAKYAPAATPIDVTAVVHANTVELLVADRGPGIPAGEEQRIFEKFYRIGPPERTPGGSGLGLTIAKGIVEAHGGTITAEHRPGGGTIIRMSLPLMRPAVSFTRQADTIAHDMVQQ